MPEISINDKLEINLLQNQISELKKKLEIEKKMFEASQLIKARMDKQSSVQQVENSLNESIDRMKFIDDQIKMIEEKLKVDSSNKKKNGFYNNNVKINLFERTRSNATDSTVYHDISESNEIDEEINQKTSKLKLIEISPSTLTINSLDYNSNTANTNNTSPHPHLNWCLAGQKLSWPRIDYKIGELAYRLKINENILEAEERLIEAFKEGKMNVDDLNLGAKKEISKQRCQILGQALKKYTSLGFNGLTTTGGTGLSTSGSILNINLGSDAGSSSKLGFGDDSFNNDNQFTGKLSIKIKKIVGLSGGSSPPFTVDLDLDQLTNFRSSASSSSKLAVSSTISCCSKDPENSSAFTCNQEIVTKLNRASELELTICSGASNSIKGIFFVKLVTLFEKGPDEKGSLIDNFEIEPMGSIQMQFHYIPDKSKKAQTDKQTISRIERRPVIKRTQHFVKGHELISTNFFQLLKCSYCQEMIMNTSGYECKLCKLICHKKCYSKLFVKCMSWDGKLPDHIIKDQQEQDPLIEQFTSKFNIPHKQKPTHLAIPSWCGHCGHMLSLGRKTNYKCEECSLVWHDRCDAHICKTHCGLNSKIIESYIKTIKIVEKIQNISNMSKSISCAELAKDTTSDKNINSKFLSKSGLGIDDFELIRCIGKGNFGKVMLAKYKTGNDSAYYAIKMLKKQSIIENEEFESLLTEKRIFELATEAQNPFLVHLQATFQDEFRIYFVMEFVSGGDLMFHIQNREFSLKDCKFYAAQIILALQFLHSKGVLYRDLKLDHILLTKNGNMKLADYGLSKCDMNSESKTRTFCGTAELMAPELLLELSYGFAVDFWSFGVLLYQLLENQSPFRGRNDKEIFQSILKGKFSFSNETDKQGKSLITKLLVLKPNERLGVSNNEGWTAIMNHPFFSEINWDAMKGLNVPVPFLPNIKTPEDVSNFDETFTNEEVALTPYPSFIVAKGNDWVSKGVSIFAEF